MLLKQKLENLINTSKEISYEDYTEKSDSNLNKAHDTATIVVGPPMYFAFANIIHDIGTAPEYAIGGVILSISIYSAMSGYVERAFEQSRDYAMRSALLEQAKLGQAKLSADNSALLKKANANINFSDAAKNKANWAGSYSGPLALGVTIATTLLLDALKLDQKDLKQRALSLCIGLTAAAFTFSALGARKKYLKQASEYARDANKEFKRITAQPIP